MTTQIAEYSPTEAAISELKTKYQAVVFDVSNTQGMTEAKKARAEVRGYRTALENKRVEIKAPALERCKLIDAEAKRITAELAALETPIDGQIKAEEERIEAAKKAKREAELARVAKIHERIRLLNEIPLKLVNASITDIKAMLDRVGALNLGEDEFFELLPQARAVLEQTVIHLSAMLEKATQNEARQAELAAERERLEKLRVEQQEADRLARENLAAEQAEQRAKLEAERIQAQAERERIREGDKVAREKLDAEAKARRDAEESEARAVREKLAEEARAIREKAAEEGRIAAEKRASERLRLERIEAEKQKKLNGYEALKLFCRSYSNDPDFQEIIIEIEGFLKGNMP